MRSRGEMLLYLKTASAANVGYSGAFGIAISTLVAVTAGAASIPGPLDEEDWDGWLYHRYFSLRAPAVIDGSVSADVDSINAGSSVLWVDVDSKAMRKFGDVDLAMFCALQVVETGMATMQWIYASWVLVKLP